MRAQPSIEQLAATAAKNVRQLIEQAAADADALSTDPKYAAVLEPLNTCRRALSALSDGLNRPDKDPRR